jgi:hypothetical protein
LLGEIFTPKSAAQFHWEGWSNLRDRSAHVFSYRIERANSKCLLEFKLFGKTYETATGTLRQEQNRNTHGIHQLPQVFGRVNRDVRESVKRSIPG